MTTHAIVIGGSITGMLAARVLSRHVDRVTVVERDELPEGPIPRKGVPQGRHGNGLLHRAWLILEDLFPGFDAALRAAGASCVDAGADMRAYLSGQFRPRYPSGVIAPFLSRPLLEWSIAARTTALSNVRVLASSDVTDLVFDPERSSVVGAKLRRGEEAFELAADLVVDAGGRGSRLPRWLKALGFSAPEQSEVPIRVGYASAIYARPEHLPDWKVMYILPSVPERRAGMILPFENDRWMVTLAGFVDDHPPADDKGFLDFARGLPIPDLAATIEGLAPLEPISLHKFPSNQRRHYERLTEFPDGLAVIGDAVCSLNPTYAQGITLNVIQAAILDASLKRHPPGVRARDFSRHLRDEIAAVVGPAWERATRDDLCYPEVEGHRPPDLESAHDYMRKVFQIAADDPEVAEAVLRVGHMLEPSSILMTPEMRARVSQL